MSRIMLAAVLAVAFSGTALLAAEGEGKARPEGDRPAKKERGEGDRGDRARGDREHGPLARVLHGMNLSEEQQGKLKEIREAMMHRMKGLMEEAKKARENKDREAMQALMQKRHQAFETFISDVRGVLTPEQQAEFDKAVEKMKEHRGERGDRPDGDRRRPGKGDGEGDRPAKRGDGDKD